MGYSLPEAGEDTGVGCSLPMAGEDTGVWCSLTHGYTLGHAVTKLSFASLSKLSGPGLGHSDYTVGDMSPGLSRPTRLSPGSSWNTFKQGAL